MVPTGASGKKFINEITILSDYLKAIAVMRTLPLQKPRRKSKVRDHLIALEKRLKLWGERNVEEFLDESKEIQELLPFTPNVFAKIHHSSMQGYLTQTL